MFTASYFLEKFRALHAVSSNYRGLTENIDIADRIGSTILSILYDRSLCNEYLDKLNTEILENIKTTRTIIPPIGYKKAIGLLYPLAPNEEDIDGSEYLKRFENLLLKTEKKHGINIGRSKKQVLEYVGLLPTFIADQSLLSNEIWNDSNMDLIGFLHGKYSHRIQLHIILRAIEEGKAD